MKFKILKVVTVGLLLSQSPITVNATIIDFEPANTSTCFSVSCTNHQGFNWGFVAGGWGITQQPFNPGFFNYNSSDGILGAKMGGNGAPPLTVTMTDTTGGIFSLGTLDAATGEGSFAGASLLDVIGTFSGGGTITQTLSITSDWSSYILSGFANLTSVVFSNQDAIAGVSLDNLNTDVSTSVPEPGTLMLLGLGIIGIRFVARKR